jgi:hypothetical protein
MSDPLVRSRHQLHLIINGAYPISCFAALATSTYAAFSQRKPHGICRRHQGQQEIWGNGTFTNRNEGQVLSGI